MKVAVIGAGSWGTALAIKASLAGNKTYIYNRCAEHAKIMAETHKNPEYLKHIELPKSIITSNDLSTVVDNANIVLLVTPSQYMRDTLIQLKPYITKDMIFVGCSKGLERSTGKRMSQVMSDELVGLNENIVILSGPNHAEEIAMNLPAMTVVASKQIGIAKIIQKALSSETFRIYTNTDMIGVELGGTTKNIIALAAGILHGKALGDNLMSALMTRGLHEMTKFGLHYGAKRETFSGLAGMGDLITTCMSSNSRNRSAGIQLAKGLTMQEILSHTNMVVEGFIAVETVYNEAKKNGIDMPVTTILYKILYGKISLENALYELMTRDLKDETELTMF